MDRSTRYGVPAFRLNGNRLAVAARAGFIHLVAIVFLAAFCLSGPALARAHRATPAAGPAPVAEAMRVVLVKIADANCGGACPEWISAEGEIMSETPAEFGKVLKVIGDRKVPVFIHSVGGHVEAALIIGRMLRAHHLDVSITRTRFEGCAPSDKICGKDRAFKGYRGMPYSAGAFCASACAFLIAGGERRLVSAFSYVGVHEITTMERQVVRRYRVMMREENGRKVEVSRKLVSEHTSDPFVVKNASLSRKYREKIAQYYREMGVSDKLVDLAFATKAADIHWMTRDELQETHLMTDFVGGETLVETAPKSVQTLPITSAIQLQWMAPGRVAPSDSAQPPGSTPVSGFPTGDTKYNALKQGQLQETTKALPSDQSVAAAPKPDAVPASSAPASAAP